MGEFLSSNPEMLGRALELVVVVVGSLWACGKSTAFYRGVQGKRYEKAVRAVEAAVEAVARDFVADAKAASSDGKLTKTEISAALTKAKAKAHQFAMNDGVVLGRELGDKYVDLAIAKAVERLKGRAA